HVADQGSRSQRVEQDFRDLVRALEEDAFFLARRRTEQIVARRVAYHNPALAGQVGDQRRRGQVGGRGWRDITIDLPTIDGRNEFCAIPNHLFRLLPGRGQVPQRVVLRDYLAPGQSVGTQTAATNAVREAQQKSVRARLLTPECRVAPGDGTVAGVETKITSQR